MDYICADGKFMSAGHPCLPVDNKAYRYGHGLFETMKVVAGKIPLASLHFDRFFSGLGLLQFTVPVHVTAAKLEERVLQLCEKNGYSQLARVRLSGSGGEGGLYDGNATFRYIIEAWPASASTNQLNENGLVIGIYPDARKACDQFSNLKSANFLPYVMAANYAKQQQWNDSLVLNQYERIADSTISNVFLITGGTISTPALGEGCINGVMRRHLLQCLQTNGYTIEETTITPDHVAAADEVLLSNAMGLRWVKQFNNHQYSHTRSTEIHRLVKTIWE